MLFLRADVKNNSQSLLQFIDGNGLQFCQLWAVVVVKN